MTELGRVMLQSLHRTLLLGSFTLLWMALRFMLCITGIMVFGTVWGALGGNVSAAVVVYVGFHVWVSKKATRLPADAPPLPSFATFALRHARLWAQHRGLQP
jgi:hypothetical protein